MNHRLSYRALIAAGLMLAAGLTACSSDTAGAPNATRDAIGTAGSPTPTANTSAPPSTAPPSTAAPSTAAPTTAASTVATPVVTPTPTASPTRAGVTPATGPVLKVTYIHCRLPAGWHRATKDVSFQIAGHNDLGDEIDLGEFPTIGPPRLGTLARASRMDTLDGHGSILAPVTVHGVRYAHVAGLVDGYQVDDYETYAHGRLLWIAGVTFTFVHRIPRAARQAIVDSVLATLVLTD